MRRNYPKAFSAVVVFLATAFFFPDGREAGAAPISRGILVQVVTVHDGDTVSVMIGRKKERVRLTGIDAPELGQRPWGGRAKSHLEELLDRSGRMVVLELDVERRDKYGRLLAYLWTRDGRLINQEMLNAGYAVLFTIPPNVRHVEELRHGERDARERGLGIWSRNGLKELPSDYRKVHPR